MTLENARQKKNKIGNYAVDNKGDKYTLLVMPKDDNKRGYYIHWCNTNLIFNDDSFEADNNLSKSSDYDVYGILIESGKITNCVYLTKNFLVQSSI